MANHSFWNRKAQTQVANGQTSGSNQNLTHQQANAKDAAHAQAVKDNQKK